jgi:pimeloyl-ACP methyl ester carboxylesterase
MAMAQIDDDVRLHFVDTGNGSGNDTRTAVLLHGFPQTSHEWRRVVPGLVDAGFRVVAPDYRGAGGSSKPAAGYDKATMAADIRTLLRDHLDIDGPIVVVGHDVGAMVALAYALDFPDEVSHLVLVDAPLPGTELFEGMKGDPRGWHAAFHNARDVAELLVQGRERPYIQHLVAVRVYDPEAIGPDDFERYVRAYEEPGAMRAGFELYRAFDQDADAVRTAVDKNGRLAMPTLAVAGAAGGMAQVMEPMVGEVAADVTFRAAPEAAHWVPEENPDFLVEAIVELTA